MSDISLGPSRWDFERIASELLRALRGRRSQSGFSKRLGYRSNVVYSWESGRAFPTAARALWAAQRCGRDVSGALLALYRKPPGSVNAVDATTPEGVVAYLGELKGRTSIVQIAEATGLSRYAISRWLKGDTEPRLPDFLRLVEVLSLRLVDFLAALVDPVDMPSLAKPWRELEVARKATYRMPWTQAVLRALETEAYTALVSHQPGWLARRMGLSMEQEKDSIELLLATKQVQWRGNKLHPSADSPVLDTRRDPSAALALRQFWSRIALERLGEHQDALCSHNVFAVSEKDLRRIRELQKTYYQEVRAIVQESAPAERVALLNLQLIPLFEP